MSKTVHTKGAPIAIIGMSADPAHKGHLKVAEAVHALGYERIIWMVTPQSPDKPKATTPYHHRVAMARLLAGRREWLEVSDAEAMLGLCGGDLRSYTLMGYMKKLYPENPFTFVIGSNNWQAFHTWGDYKDFLNRASLLVMPRPGSGKLDDTLAATTLANKRDKEGEVAGGIVPVGTWRIFSDFAGGAVSSQAVREGQGQVREKWLNAAQLEYIKKYKLYV